MTAIKTWRCNWTNCGLLTATRLGDCGRVRGSGQRLARFPSVSRSAAFRLQASRGIYLVSRNVHKAEIKEAIQFGLLLLHQPSNGGTENVKLLLELRHAGYVGSHLPVDVFDTAVNRFELLADITKVFDRPDRACNSSPAMNTWFPC
jgi:hypothetical protein